MNPSRTKTAKPGPISDGGFTLLEVLAATAVAAILLSAIALNAGLKNTLLSANTDNRPAKQLNKRMKQILAETPVAELQALSGTEAKANPLSDPITEADAILVAIERLDIGSDTPANVLSITLSRGSDTLTQWLSPVDTR